MSPFPRNEKLLERARQFRREMTRQERHLWYDYLRSCPARFYRQRIIGNYIADFYCHSRRLVIEVDGSQHGEDEAVLYDKERTAYLNSLGITVIRFTNVDVDRNFPAVCARIEEFLKGSPLGGAGTASRP